MATKIGTPGDDVLQGTPNDDLIDGGLGNDFINGTPGRDTVYGGGGDDDVSYYNLQRPYLLDGGDGLDRLFFSRVSSQSGIVFSFATPNAVQVVDGDVRITGFERGTIVGSETGNDVLTGGSYSNSFFAGGGNDLLIGGSGTSAYNEFGGDAGNDTLIGGGGGSYNRLYGSAGDDLIAIQAGNGRTTVDGGDNVDTLRLDYTQSGVTASIDLSPSKLGNDPLHDGTVISEIERFEILGGAGNDSVLAGSGNDTVRGAEGNDSLAGGAGDDALRGGENNDTLNGGTGNDTMSGGQGDDALYSNSNQGIDSLDGGSGIDFAKIDRAQSATAFSFSLFNPSSLATLADGTTITNIERIQFEAGSGADSLTGGALNDVLAGGGSNDSLKGGGGDDVLIGGAGNDTIRGGDGTDVLQLSGTRANYAFTNLGDGSYSVTDTRGGAPDGTDTFSGIETLHFADGYAKLNVVVR